MKSIYAIYISPNTSAFDLVDPVTSTHPHKPLFFSETTYTIPLFASMSAASLSELEASGLVVEIRKGRGRCLINATNKRKLGEELFRREPFAYTVKADVSALVMGYVITIIIMMI